MAEKEQTDYGPLAGLIGTWQGDQGMDVAPEPDGSEENPYEETIVFEAAGTATNAESQTLAVVRYHQVVRRKSNGEVFHDQVGYWTWDGGTGEVAQSLAIPRAVCALAGGRATVEPGRVELFVRAKQGADAWGIVQAPFMLEKARTVGFEHRLTLEGDRMVYEETTHLEIYGSAFEHTDRNELVRQ